MTIHISQISQNIGLAALNAPVSAASTPAVLAQPLDSFCSSWVRPACLAVGLLFAGCGAARPSPTAARRSPDICQMEEALLMTSSEGAELILQPSHYPSHVRNCLISRLGIPPRMVDRWIETERIPLSELRQAARLDRFISLETLRSLSTVFLDPPPDLHAPMSSFNERSERFFLFLEDLRHVPETRTRVFWDRRFHSRGPAPEDALDTFSYWFVPPGAGIQPEDLIGLLHRPERYGAFSRAFRYEGMSQETAHVDATQIFLRWIRMTLGGLRLDVAMPRDPVLLPGRVSLTSWIHVPPQRGGSPILRNDGWWMAFPLERGGFLLVRAIQLNSVSDHDQDAIHCGLGGTHRFVESAIRHLLRGRGRSEAAPTYGRETIVTETGNAPPRPRTLLICLGEGR